MTDDASLQPELGVVLQEEPEDRPQIEVCVRDVHGPVRTQSLPLKAATAFTKTIPASTAQPTMVLSADHYRGQALIVCSVAIRVTLNDPSEPWAWWPANVPLPITASVNVYVRSNDAASTVSVIAEKWATGE